jgi:hypothetical protein
MILKLGHVGKYSRNTPKSFYTWCWRKMEKISWTDRVRNVEVLHGVKEDTNILRTIKRRKANWIGDSLHRNCLIKHITEEKIGEGSNEKT